MEEEKLCNDGGGGKGERLHLLELLLLLSSPPMGGECLGVKTGFLQFNFNSSTSLLQQWSCG